MPELTVVGIGSRYGRDDAVGLLLVETLSASATRHVRTQVWENADALTLVHDLLELTGPVLVVDCADMGLKGGEWRFLTWQEGRCRYHRSSVSTHGLGMAEALAMARDLGFTHPIHLFGVQPFDLSPFQGLTTEMQGFFSAALQALEATICRLLGVVDSAIAPICRRAGRESCVWPSP
ncbi:MAG: hydrogenase maturation protease [Magnetococcales bacterium]|nr:hydrogenase maturation protease [Magnetococcales bacterium]